MADLNATATTPTVVVVGGGISGMATGLAVLDLAAQRWSGQPPRLHVLEAERRAGGKIQTSVEEGYTCEWGVNGFLNKEPKTLELVQRLELEDQLLPASVAFGKRYIFTRGKLRQVHMHPLKFMFSRLLPLRAKLRLLREPWIKGLPPADRDESVAEFARRRIGDVAYQILVDPMQTGIYAGDPERMSVASCFPRVVEVEREYGSLIRGMVKLAKERRTQGEPLPGAGPSGHLTSFKGGMQTLIDRLVAQLGDRVRCGAPVRAIRRDGQRYLVAVEGDGESIAADSVVLACPAHAAAGIVRELDAELGGVLGEISYPPMAVVCLGYRAEQIRHPVDGFGFLAPRASRLRILGALWASATFPDNAPPEHVLLRVMLGGARDERVLDLDDDELQRLVCDELGRVQGISGAPGYARVFRHPLAIPQYLVGHGTRLTRLETCLKRWPGLLITGNAYRGIGVNDCARNAWPVAEQVLATSRSEG
jgi:protoporphyrinogen/coproporphyrinogen III oxidase